MQDRARGRRSHEIRYLARCQTAEYNHTAVCIQDPRMEGHAEVEEEEMFC